MKCPQCQHENSPPAKFCEECAAPLARSCSNCGTQLSPTAKFCPECAHPVAIAGATQPRFSSPDVYTPKHLVEKILTSKSALEGERKQVTVLFADMKGSMELLADRDPEEARKLLDPVLERMMEAVHRYEGTVNQVMGDGIMALFGAPLAHEDHAIRACYAALRMHEAVARYADELRRRHGLDVQIRVGLNSGEVVVRSIGSDLHMDYTAVGQTTHLAARMEQLARPGATLLTGDTLRLAEGYVQVKALGPTPVRGLNEPVEIYEVTGAGAARTRLQASAARGLTRFVGRDAELEQLRRAVEKARGGHGQVVAIVGEAGVGKSRLLYEFTHSHRAQGWLLLESRSVSYGKATSYLPVVDVLKAYFKVQDRDDHREIREKVTGKLLALDETLKATLPAFLALLDVPIEDPQWQGLDPPQRRLRTLDAVKRLLLRESQVQPLLLVFEDLHWIDTETQALLDHLIESLPTTRLLLLVNYRPEYQHSWTSKTFYSQLRLDTLPPESTGELLDALLGTDPGLQSLKQQLLKRGNPFFLEESVRTLVETKALVGERGAYRLTQPLQTLQVPATVHAVLAARVDRLPVEEKQLLQAAAVVGKDVPYAVLYAIAELPEEVVRRGLMHLQAAEFLYETSLFPDLEYTFKHALTHEVTYRGLLNDRRRILHARIVEAIEQLYPNRLVEQVERLAYHSVRGESWEKAVAYLSEAGDKAVLRSAFHEALASFEGGLAALRHLPGTRGTLERAVDLHIKLSWALRRDGQLARNHDHLQEAHALANRLGDQRRSARVAASLALHFQAVGDPDRAIESSQAALVIAHALGDDELRLLAAAGAGQAHYARGDYCRARDILLEALEPLEGHAGVTRVDAAEVVEYAVPQLRRYLVRCLAELGQFPEATGRAEEALQIAEAGGVPSAIVNACHGVGYVCLRKGDLDRAIPVLERGLSVAREWSLQTFLPPGTEHLGFAYALSRRFAEAVALLEEAVERGATQGMMTTHARRVGWLSEAHLLATRVEEAARLAERALDLSREHNERGHEAWVLRLLGEIFSSRDPSPGATAEAHYRQAFALAEELGMRPLLAHCHLGLGKLYRRTGKRDQAHEHLTTATTMLREMDMQFWLEQAEAELKESA
jgi:class 3 adenylate cyclase/tetratricopeptide (TPR) repeat protein